MMGRGEVMIMVAHLTGEFIANGGVPVGMVAPVSLPGLVLAAALLASLVVIALMALPKRFRFRMLRGGLSSARRAVPRRRPSSRLVKPA
jgi:hypothetical protein